MLSITKLRTAKPSEKPYRLQDQNNLYCLVLPSGAKSFRYDVAVRGKRKTITLGLFPEVSLDEAREKMQALRKRVRAGEDITAKHVGDSFRMIAEDFGARRINRWSERHPQKRRLELYVYPRIGTMPIESVRPVDIINCLRPLEDRGVGETAHRVLNLIGQVFRYSVALGKIPYDITGALRGALAPVKGGHFSAIMDLSELARYRDTVATSASHEVVKTAMSIAPHIFVRSGELVSMEWGHVDLEAREWRYTVSKTKTAHIVPLSDFVLDKLRILKEVTGNKKYVFQIPSSGRHITTNALLVALKRMGFQETIHGFRATARTLLAEHKNLKFPESVIELQLAHEVRDTLGRSYNRTTFLDDRHLMMKAWSDFLLGL